MRGHSPGRRLVEAVTVHDPLFDDDDVEEILDLVEYEDSLCPGCGNPKAETFHPANEFAYEATTLACAACASQRRAEKKLDVLDGVYSVARKRPPREEV